MQPRTAKATQWPTHTSQQRLLVGLRCVGCRLIGACILSLTTYCFIISNNGSDFLFDYIECTYYIDCAKQVKVPNYIAAGDRVIVDTRTREFVQRA